MENAYRVLLDQILSLMALQPADPAPPLNDLRNSLAAVRAREHNIPGISAATDSRVPASS